MHSKNFVAFATAIGLASSLSACVVTPKYKENSSAESLVSKNIEESLAKIEDTQAELVQAGGIEQSRNGLSNQVYFDNQPVSFEWYGDAYTAVQQLANQRGYRFYSSGVRLPLPVALNVKKISYTALMQRLQTQIGYRASIDVDHSRREISLRYTQPNARGGDSQAQMGISGQPYFGAKPLFNGQSARGVMHGNTSNETIATAGLPDVPTNISANPLHVFRSGSGHLLPLPSAVKQIIPSGWTAEISEPIESKYKKKRFDWVGNDWWPQVLDKTLAGTDLMYSTDTTKKKIVLIDRSLKAHPPAPSKPLTQVNLPKTYADQVISKPSVGVLLQAVPTGKEWIANSGTTLRESITTWAHQATCPQGGAWVVMWPTTVDYRIEAPVTLRGSFEEAIVKMFDLYSVAEKPLYVLANRNQCLISVDDKPQNQ